MNLAIAQHEGTLVVDSRLIADELGIQHKNVLATIKKYVDEIQDFGHLAFQTETVSNTVGAKNAVVFCYLNEDQATYLMTLSKNTDKVRECKRTLVKAFRDAKQVIKTVIPQQSEQIKELEMQLELARTQERLANSQHKLLATVHLLETVAPGLAPLALGRPDAVITRNEYIERTITNNGTFEGVGITYIQKRFGFKTTKAAWNWLETIGYGKDSGWWESQPTLVHTPRLTPEHLEVVSAKFANKEGDRQRFLGE
jgi:phage regulator Rha-like protein